MNGSLSKRKGGWWRSGTLWFWLLLLAAAVLWNWNALTGVSEGQEIHYSQFRSELEAGNISRVEIEGSEIRGEFKGTESPDESRGFRTYLPSIGDDELLPALRRHDVEIITIPESRFSWSVILISLLPVLLLVVVFFLIFRASQMQGRGLLQMRKSRAKPYDRKQEKTTFDDVAGAEGAKTELAEIIEFLKDPARFHHLGGVIPRGVLLVGPPGTGKTLLARAVAGEAHVPFFSLMGSDFMEMFVGVGASRVRDLFQAAKANAPSIIFIDEPDSIGRRRGAGLGGGHDEREQTLNQLLSEMDGFQRNQGVILMAATNLPDILDPALLRPGRFDRRISVDLPTLRDRIEILQIHARGKPVAEEVDLKRLARSTPGFSGADLANLLNEAALLAARKEKREIDRESLDEARDKILMGLTRKSLVLEEKEREILAFHEAGHAIIGANLLGAQTIHKVSIVPRGRSMGVTQQFPDEDRYLYSREDLINRLALMLGGRAAEELRFESISTGAEDDLKKATRLARRMVVDWGMSERLGWTGFGDGREEVFLRSGEELQ